MNHEETAVFVIRLWEPQPGARAWAGDLENCVGRTLAQASAPTLWAVLDMLQSVLQRETDGNAEDTYD